MKNFNINRKMIIFTISILLGVTTPVLIFAATAVSLGTSGNFEILAKTGVSTTGTTSVVGNIGVSPAAASYITGFALTLPSASPFATSALVNGDIYASDYTSPTGSNLMSAVLDMQTAYTSANSVAPTVTELGAGNIGGLTLMPGVYKWSSAVTIPTDVTLSGGPNDVWIFQVAQNLDISSGTKIILSGGAQASNVFWIVAGQTTIGTTALFNGNILDQTAIILNTGAILNGRALAQTAVTLDSNSVIFPGFASVAATPAPTPTPAPVVTSTTAVTTTATQTNTTQPTTVTPVITQTQTEAGTQLTNLQQEEYNQFISAGANPSVALNAVMQIETATQVPSAYTTISASTPEIKQVVNDLYQGETGTDVAILQQFLISQNKGPSAQALASVGATSYFGPLTEAALAEFQANAGISPAAGYFGTITRVYIDTNY